MGPGFVGESEGIALSLFLFIMRTVSALAEDARWYGFCVEDIHFAFDLTCVFGLALSL